MSCGHYRACGDILEIFLKYTLVRVGKCAFGEGLLKGPL